MSHESVVASLKLLLKQELLTINPADNVRYMNSESDRASIILSAATLEQILVYRLEAKMSALNRDELDRLFHYEGPCGSFSSRIRMAQALGIIDRPTRKRIELIKEMRNLCAHCHGPVGFSTAAIKDAVIQLYGSGPKTHIEAYDPAKLRTLFVTLASHMAADIANEKVTDPAAVFQKVQGKETTLKSWPEIPPGA